MDSIDGDEQKRNAASLKIDGIKYRADKQLIHNADMSCTLESDGINRLRSSPFSKDERLDMALNFLKDKNRPFMRLSDYVKMTGLSRTKASLELKEFCDDTNTGITFSGQRSSRVYYIDTDIFNH